MGKFTKSGKFRLHITALPYLAEYAQAKVWVKPEAEMSYLYGNHLLKAGVAKTTEGMARNVGCVIMNEHDIPVGFGTTACSSLDFTHLSPSAIVAYNQGDLGEYLREEETMMAGN